MSEKVGEGYNNIQRVGILEHCPPCYHPWAAFPWPVKFRCSWCSCKQSIMAGSRHHSRTWHMSSKTSTFSKLVRIKLCIIERNLNLLPLYVWLKILVKAVSRDEVLLKLVLCFLILHFNSVVFNFFFLFLFFYLHREIGILKIYY
jgi:hypothetical protein